MAKLFIVTGFVWGFELFVWKLKKKGETLPWYLVFPDLLSVSGIMCYGVYAVFFQKLGSLCL